MRNEFPRLFEMHVQSCMPKVQTGCVCTFRNIISKHKEGEKVSDRERERNRQTKRIPEHRICPVSDINKYANDFQGGSLLHSIAQAADAEGHPGHHRRTYRPRPRQGASDRVTMLIYTLMSIHVDFWDEPPTQPQMTVSHYLSVF